VGETTFGSAVGGRVAIGAGFACDAVGLPGGKRVAVGVLGGVPVGAGAGAGMTLRESTSLLLPVFGGILSTVGTNFLREGHL
jgi:hypothetical protein